MAADDLDLHFRSSKHQTFIQHCAVYDHKQNAIEKLDYPVVYVLDDISLLYNNVTATQRIDFINAFRTEIIDGGKQYKFALGLNQKLLQQYPGKYVDTSKLTGTDLWIINYRAESLGSGYQGKGNVVMWRYTNQGTVNGVNGKVNISIRYKTY